MRFPRTVLLSCSLMFAGQVFAQEADLGGDVDAIRQQLIDKCGDPNADVPADSEAILSCQEQTLEDLAVRLELPQDVVLALSNEIQVFRAFQDGLESGKSVCGSKEGDGQQHPENSGGDSAGAGEVVTVCFVSPRRSDRSVTLHVPRPAAEVVLDAGGYEGPCQEGSGGGNSNHDNPPRPGADNGGKKKDKRKDVTQNKSTKKKGGVGKSAGREVGGKRNSKKSGSTTSSRGDRRRR